MHILLNILTETWQVMSAMAPYLLLGFFFAGLLAVFISPAFVEEHLGRKGIKQVFKAALFGIPIPLCSCSVIPVTASLHQHGASRGATIAFLTSTPQTGVDSIMVTYGLLGPVFAVVRVIAALLTGLFAGVIVDNIAREKSGIREASSSCCCCGKEKPSKLKKFFQHGFVTLPRDLGKALLLGLLLSGILGAVVPDNFFADKLDSGLLSMILVMGISIPFYVCSTASVPIAYALIAMGLSPGAALVFLITGPATNAASFTIVWKMIGRRSTMIYIGVIACSALAAGLALDALMPAYLLNGTLDPHHHEMSAWWKQGAAVLLLGLILVTNLPRSPRAAASAGGAAV